MPLEKIISEITREMKLNQKQAVAFIFMTCYIYGKNFQCFVSRNMLCRFFQ